MRYRFGGLIFGRAYTWRGLFSEFYAKFLCFFNHNSFVLKQEGHPATLSTTTLILTIMIKKRFEEDSEDRDH